MLLERLFFKIFFICKYIKILFFLCFKNYFKHQHVKTINKLKKIILNKKLKFKKISFETQYRDTEHFNERGKEPLLKKEGNPFR